ncbi:MAG: hypothetical protein AAF568_12090 [Pseudomonadota bacterium]
MTRPYFVIFAAMRTGSNLLERLLGQLGEVKTFGEAFNPAFAGGPNKQPLKGWTLAERDADPLAYLAAMRKARPRKIIGFRHFDGHNPAVRRWAMADPDCAQIVLTRAPWESYVSLQLARATDQWLLTRPERRKAARVRFDPRDYTAYAAAQEAYYAQLSGLRVDYAELLDLATINRLAAHIGASKRLDQIAPGILRQNPEPLSAKVENYAEMVATLGFDPEA